MAHSWNDQHMIRTAKSMLRAVYITLGVFLVLFTTFHLGAALYSSYLADKQERLFQAGIQQDEDYLKVQGDAVATNPKLIERLLAEDTSGLIALTQEEKSKRSIGLMGVTNADGVIISRTLSPSKLGDNVFLTSPGGRSLAKGKSFQSIELPGFFHQIFMTTGRLVMSEGQVIGALFANYLTDDAYATKFRDTYLSKGVEVVFYAKDFGVYGDSFSDQKIRMLVESYFNSGSDWIKNGLSGKTISFNDGTSYLVDNIVFPGLEKSPGGALIFIPRHDLSNFANITTALIILLVFLGVTCRQHLASAGEEHGWRYWSLLLVLSLPVFGLAFFAFHAQNIGRLRLGHVPYTIYNSTIRLYPEWGVYDKGFEQRFSVIVETGDESINAVQVGLVFDPQAVEVKALEVASSTCSYVVENVVDQKAGFAHLGCVILNPKDGQRVFTVADVVLVPSRVGNFTLSFDSSETKVLANDGLGTDVLRMSQNGSYTVNDFDSSLGQAATSTRKDQSIVIFSPTHPNQSRWYNSLKASFVWQGKPDAVYRYSFDSAPDTIPAKDHTTQGSTVDVAVPGDGIFYFHLQPVSGGPVSHYRIQSDMTPPTILAMNFSSANVVAGDVVRFSFEAEDPRSGVQRNYYVDLGDHLFLPVGSQLFIPFLEAGDQKVILRVYDGAGNYAEKTEIIHVADR